MLCIKTPHKKGSTEYANFMQTMGEILRDNPDYELLEFCPTTGWKNHGNFEKIRIRGGEKKGGKKDRV